MIDSGILKIKSSLLLTGSKNKEAVPLGTLCAQVVRRSSPGLEPWKDGHAFPCYLEDLFKDILVSSVVCVSSGFVSESRYSCSYV